MTRFAGAGWIAVGSDLNQSGLVEPCDVFHYILGFLWVPDVPVQNAEIAAMFDQAAELLEIGGENQFRVRAYRRAARVIEGLPKAAGALLKSGRDLSELPGIGKDLAGKIVGIVHSGHLDLLDELLTGKH